MKQGEGISQKTYMHTHRHRQQCGHGLREGREGWVEGGKGGNSDMCNSVNNKKKKI